MAMSRVLSQTLLPSSLIPRAVITYHRHRSNKSHQAQLFEVEVDSSSPSSHPESSEEVIPAWMKELDEEIHSAIVRRAAPDWLPFLPGHSYWVPPRSSTMRQFYGMIEVIGRLNSSRLDVGKSRAAQFDLLTEDETMSVTSTRGWPSSAYFFKGTSPVPQSPSVEVEVKIQNEVDNERNISNSDDEEA